MADKNDKKTEDAPEQAEVKEGEPTPENAEGAEAGGGAKRSKKTLILLAACIVLLLGGGAGAYFAGIIPGMGGSHAANEEMLMPKILYYDLEEFLVNLNDPGKKVSFLKMSVTLELPNDRAKALVEAQLPHIRDSFQVYLRELRSTDLQGSAGLVRLREELLLRINKILETERVKDILFKEIIVQ